MRLKFLLIVSLFLCVTTAFVHAQKQFPLFASIVDVTGAPVAALQPADVEVQENGAEARVIKVEAMDWPTKVQVLVDNGVGLGGSNISLLKNGIIGLLDALPPGVEVTIVSTAPQPRILAKPTTDREAMMKGLALLASDGGAGRLQYRITTYCEIREIDSARTRIILLGAHRGETSTRLASAMRGGLNRERF